ncbi:MAG: ATP-binding protein [Elusimicrobiota bacterium]
MNQLLDKVGVEFPSDLDYIPAIRKFISDIAVINKFPRRFAFRTEVIIDEICSNAVLHGSQQLDSKIGIECLIFSDRIELFIENDVGDLAKVENLAKRISEEEDKKENVTSKNGRGLRIVKLLSNKINLIRLEKKNTRIRIVKYREDKPAFVLMTDSVIS